MIAVIVVVVVWPHHVACGIFVPQSGTEPGPWPGNLGVLTIGPPGNSPSDGSSNTDSLVLPGSLNQTHPGLDLGI